MKRFFAYLLVLAAGFLSVFVLTWIPIIGRYPKWLLILTVFFSLYSDRWFGLQIGCLSGLLQDLFSTTAPFGTGIVVFGAIGYYFGAHKEQFYRENPLTQGLLCSAASIVACFSSVILARFWVQTAGLPRLILATMIPASVFTAAASPFVFSFLRKAFKL